MAQINHDRHSWWAEKLAPLGTAGGEKGGSEGGTLTRRRFLQAGAVLTGTTLAGGLAACAPTPSTPTPPTPAASSAGEPVRLGYLPITDATPLLIAYARGFYAEEGLAAEKPTLLRGWSQLAEAFMARTFNLTHLLFPIPIYMRYSLNFPVKVVAWDHVNNSALTVSAAGGIKTPNDLGGKHIAVPYWYSQHNIILQLLLRSAGLEPVIQDRTAPLRDNQTNLFVMSPPDMPPALQTGAIDGYIVAEPFNAAGELLAGGRIVRFNGDVWKNHPCCVAVMHEDRIKTDASWSQRVVNAIVKAELWSAQNRAEAAHILSKEGEGYLPLPEKVILHSMVSYDLETYGLPGGTGAIRHPEWGVQRIGFSPYPYPSATQRIVELLKETRLEGDASFLRQLEPKRVADDLVDYRLVTAALERVGGPEHFDGVDVAKPFERQEAVVP